MVPASANTSLFWPATGYHDFWSAVQAAGNAPIRPYFELYRLFQPAWAGVSRACGLRTRIAMLFAAAGNLLWGQDDAFFLSNCYPAQTENPAHRRSATGFPGSMTTNWSLTVAPDRWHRARIARAGGCRAYVRLPWWRSTRPRGSWRGCLTRDVGTLSIDQTWLKRRDCAGRWNCATGFMTHRSIA